MGIYEAGKTLFSQLERRTLEMYGTVYEDEEGKHIDAATFHRLIAKLNVSS